MTSNVKLLEQMLAQARQDAKTVEDDKLKRHEAMQASIAQREMFEQAQREQNAQLESGIAGYFAQRKANRLALARALHLEKQGVAGELPLEDEDNTE